MAAYSVMHQSNWVTDAPPPFVEKSRDCERYREITFGSALPPPAETTAHSTSQRARLDLAGPCSSRASGNELEEDPPILRGPSGTAVEPFCLRRSRSYPSTNSSRLLLVSNVGFLQPPATSSNTSGYKCGNGDPKSNPEFCDKQEAVPREGASCLDIERCVPSSSHTHGQQHTDQPAAIEEITASGALDALHRFYRVVGNVKQQGNYPDRLLLTAPYSIPVLVALLLNTK